MSSVMRWASACRSGSRPVASTAGSAATAPLRAARAGGGSGGTRSLAAAPRLSDGGRRRYHAGRGPGGRRGGSASTCDASLPRAQRRGQICARRPAMPEAPVARLAAAIETLVRAHKAATPAPRGLQYLGLERASGTGFHLLDALAARGIFRKYELVLDLGAGLGGTSRWLAARLGCEVVGTAASRAEADAGEALTRRARLSPQVRLVPADPAPLPFPAPPFPPLLVLEALPPPPHPTASASRKSSPRRSPTARCASSSSSPGGPEGPPGILVSRTRSPSPNSGAARRRWLRCSSSE